MKDMFYKYDNCIDKKEYDPPMPPIDQPNRRLESQPTLSLIIDAKGNQVGLVAKYRSAFDLFFYMDGCVEGSSIEELVLNSNISFQIVDYYHRTVVEKTISSADAYIGNDTIKISITESDAEKLKQETYKINLALNWPGGGYTLFTETDGILAIR